MEIGARLEGTGYSAWAKTECIAGESPHEEWESGGEDEPEMELSGPKSLSGKGM